MSTWLYLVCLDHTPPLMADGESGQHLSDLDTIRHTIAKRSILVPLWESGSYEPFHHFRRNSLSFLSDHPACRIGIRDEYGRDHDAVGVA